LRKNHDKNGKGDGNQGQVHGRGGMAGNVNKGVKAGDAEKRGDTKIPQMIPDNRPFPDEPFDGKGGRPERRSST